MTVHAIAHYRKSDNISQSVEEHCFEVGKLAKEFAEKIELGYVGELLGLLHDAGKVSEQFQNYLKSAVEILDPDCDEDYVDAQKKKGKIDHSTAGAQWIWNELSKVDLLGAQILAICISSHHSGLIDCIGCSGDRYGKDIFSARMEKPEPKSHYREMADNFSTKIQNRCREILCEEKGLFENRIRQILRLYQTEPVSCRNQISLLIRFVFSCLIDADRIDSACFEFPYLKLFLQKKKTTWNECIRRFENHLTTLTPNYEIDTIREKISNDCKQRASATKGIFSLSVPTGGGKTYSSLRFALHHAEQHNMDRIFYFVPFTSIIDQNAKVVRKALQDKNRKIVVENHSNLTPRRQSYREKIVCANWDAPIVLTTMVQFLESLFGGGTRGARRMHQLANSVMIFDEVQSIPINCIHLFNQAVNFLVEQCGSTVILSTATQPLLHTVDKSKGYLKLDPSNEIVKDPSELFARLQRTVVHDRTKPGGWKNNEIADLINEQTASKKSCLVVANTKKMARAIFELVDQAKEREWEIYHLSTNMCPAHRKVVLRAIKNRLVEEKPVVCVSTQLIEAGVDVDFGAAIRFLAGLDSIAQTAGRCNRNGRQQNEGNVFVINPSEESLFGLPAIQIASKCTQRVLQDFRENPNKFGNDLISPKAMNWFYKIYYYEHANKMDYPIDESKIGHADSMLNLLGLNRFAVSDTSQRPPYHLHQAFMTAGRNFETINTPTQGVIVPFGRRGKALIDKLGTSEYEQENYELLREAQQFTVNVFPFLLTKLQEQNAIDQVIENTEIYCLDEQFYDKQFGLATDPVSPMEFLNA